MVRPAGGMAAVETTQDEVADILRVACARPASATPTRSAIVGRGDQEPLGLIISGAFAVMILISGISLVVGAIVIANIMFVSVVERTQEIGLRRALGARSRDIRRQFLPSRRCSAGGGLVGVALGMLVAMAVSVAFPCRRSPRGWSSSGSCSSVVTGFLAGLPGGAGGEPDADRGAAL